MAARKGGLGRGLDALIPKRPEIKENQTFSAETKTEKAEAWEKEKTSENRAISSKNEDPAPEGKQTLKLSEIEPNRKQPRKRFNEDALTDLADSIRKHGVVQPLLVQKKGSHYEIIAGERRWRAAKMAGLKEVPVTIRDYSDQEAVEVSLIENIQREDLNPMEEANAYRRLMDEFSLSQEKVAEKVSRSRAAVANSLRLLKLSGPNQERVETGELSEGHARAILGLPDAAAQERIAEMAVNGQWSVRQTEKAVRDIVQPRAKSRSNPLNDQLLAVYDKLAEELKQVLGTKVAIRPTGKDKGKIEIDYYNVDELDRIAEQLKNSGDVL